ncbi:MAG: hypothetical protein EOP11_03280 [Proteobacteria bacterium]|nr:MAG: hypothetical protein EOP11_03280 [Pseudomonadota bacterium]
MFLFAIVSSTLALAGPIETHSIFFQSADAIRRSGSFACEARPLGESVKNQAALCGQPISAWKQFSLSLIELPAYSGRGDKLTALREVVARNNRITEAYAQLYLLSHGPRSTCGRSVLPWVGGASLGSLKSGQVMRSGLSSYVGGIPDFDSLADANYRPRFEQKFTPLLAGYALQSATLTLGVGNFAIFEDLYWQLLAGTTCGPAQVIKTIETTPGWERDAKLKLSHRIWRQLEGAVASCDERGIIEANKGFVELEQYLVGQAAMYEGFTRSFGGWALSSIIEPAVPASLGTFPTFEEHASRSVPEYQISFSNPKQRVSWMQDQLGVMDAEFLAKQDYLPALFCAAAADSEKAERIIKGL